MRVSRSESIRLVIVATALVASVCNVVAQGATFDTASVVAATVVSDFKADGAVGDSDPIASHRSATPHIASTQIASADISVSCVNEQRDVAAVDRWIVKIRPRMVQSFRQRAPGDSLGSESHSFPGPGRIVDYSPRTQTASNIDGPVVVKKTDEQSASSGLSIDASYATAIGHIGGDNGSKQSEITEFRRLPELHAIVASGTIDRSTGVVYKISASPHSVLEGEKTFSISFEVPHDWRGSMIDVEVTTVETVDGKYPWGDTSQRKASYHFAVAAYRAGDMLARQDAQRVAQTESRLWDHAAQQAKQPHRASGLMRTLASTFGHTFSGKAKRSVRERASVGGRSEMSDDWVSRIVRGIADPHLDQQIVRRSVAERVLALEYVDAQQRLFYGAQTETLADSHPHTDVNRVVMAKVPVTESRN